MSTTTSNTEAANLNWLLQNFVTKVPGVVDAAVVSSDGLLMAMSPGIGRAGGDQLAAVASGPTPWATVACCSSDAADC